MTITVTVTQSGRHLQPTLSYLCLRHVVSDNHFVFNVTFFSSLPRPILTGGEAKTPTTLPALQAKREQNEDEIIWERRGSLVYNMAKFKRFPLHDKANFATIRRNAELAYFDRTSYILAIRDTLADALLFLRPRRFGKSLTVDMLECFHGVQYKADYQTLFKVCSNTFFFCFF